MTQIIDGNALAKEVTKHLRKEVEVLVANGVVPKLVNIGINPDERSLRYIKMKARLAEEVGIRYEHQDLSNYTQEQCLERMAGLANDASVHGIIVQLPVHDWYDPQSLLNSIPLGKDVDGLSDQSLLALQDNASGLTPATPLAILELCSRSGIALEGKRVVIVGQGKLVGLPLGIILRGMDIDVTTADTSTLDLKSITKRADVLISATGKPNLITHDMISRGAVVIDAGIIEVNGRVQGDVDFDNVVDTASVISPVPGGVGPLTVAMLLSNVVDTAKKIL